MATAASDRNESFHGSSAESIEEIHHQPVTVNKSTSVFLAGMQWLFLSTVRLLLFSVSLVSLVFAKLSFAAMARELINGSIYETSDAYHEKSQTSKTGSFWRLVFVLVIPNIFSLIRCMWCGLISRTNREFPWPVKRSVIGVSSLDVHF